MIFIPAFKPQDNENRPTLWFVFQGYKLLVARDGSAFRLPDEKEINACGIASQNHVFLGTLGTYNCFATQLSVDHALPETHAWINLRGLVGRIDEELFWIAGLANHLLDWERTHRFCSQCGQPMQDKTDERAKQCPACGLTNYPRLNPAVIMAVVREGKLLLARNTRFKGSFFSVLAGFVEPGETLEACVRREIKEEVGIAVENIRYFGSQPWPFPNSLMVGFTADYAGGEIQVDNAEIMEADWFTPDTLPQVPPRISIARQLIDWFVNSF